MTTRSASQPAAGEVAVVDLDDSFARELPELYAERQPSPVPAPELVAFNETLANELGLDPTILDSAEGAALLAGNTVPAGATSIAMAYAGHQFGSYSPRLGDGRALLLGEIIDPAGNRRDLHLKGSGRTPFARGGDGKAALGPMLREFLIAEAMHASRMPTTRALAVTVTGEVIDRDGPVPGAVLARVAASHLRVGTFQYAASLDDPTVLKRLADYAIDRHHPTSRESGNPYLALLEAVIEAQAALVAEWMLAGFIHGVLNTDNVTISGEGIDYGPCAFMERFDPATVFSSIDHQGRYAYDNQPAVTQWNLARFAETLLPLIGPDHETAVAAATKNLETFPNHFQHQWENGMKAKLGLASSTADEGLFADYLKLLTEHKVDYTTSFRALAQSLRGDDQPLHSLFNDRSALGEWADQWRSRLDIEGRDPVVVATEMDRVNPIYIPRNQLVEEALRAATEGDLDPFRELLDVVTDPFEERTGADRFARPSEDGFDRNYQTFCGT